MQTALCEMTPSPPPQARLLIQVCPSVDGRRKALAVADWSILIGAATVTVATNVFFHAKQSLNRQFRAASSHNFPDALTTGRLDTLPPGHRIHHAILIQPSPLLDGRRYEGQHANYEGRNDGACVPRPPAPHRRIICR